MCVSSKICKENCGLVFDLLHSKAESGLKINLVIALTDMFRRFPNLLNEKKHRLFKALKDGHSKVRRQTLVSITHLILSDTLKIRGEIVDLCMLLSDSDLKIK